MRTHLQLSVVRKVVARVCLLLKGVYWILVDTSPPHHLTQSSPNMIHLTLIAFHVSVQKTEARFFLILFNIAITFILNPPIHFTILVKISQSTLEMTNWDL